MDVLAQTQDCILVVNGRRIHSFEVVKDEAQLLYLDQVCLECISQNVMDHIDILDINQAVFDLFLILKDQGQHIEQQLQIVWVLPQLHDLDVKRLVIILGLDNVLGHVVGLLVRPVELVQLI